MSERLRVHATPLAGLGLVERQRLGDARGFLERLFCAEALHQAGWTAPIAQINRTFTQQRGTLRGLHFQRPPHAEDKLVHCLRGEVFDVAVDLRQGSPTFGRFHAQRLSGEEPHALLIPKGFAHGFQTLSEDVEMLYLHSHPYHPEAEGGLHALDERLAIPWPLSAGLLSPRDAGLPRFDAAFVGMLP